MKREGVGTGGKTRPRVAVFNFVGEIPKLPIVGILRT